LLNEARILLKKLQAVYKFNLKNKFSSFKVNLIKKDDFCFIFGNKQLPELHYLISVLIYLKI
jgi:hypothetical protein